MYAVALLVCVAADDKPTSDEQAAMAALVGLGAKVTLDASLHPAARLAVRSDGPVTDAGLLALKKYPQIGSLDLIDLTRCTDKGYATFKDFPHLRKLNLTKAATTDKGFAHLCECKELRGLAVLDGTVTDAGLVGLKELTRLERLDLSGNPNVTDKGLASVKVADRLQVLSLAGTGVTDKGLAELKSLDGLRQLNVVKTKVTATAAEKFADEMPNLRAVRR